MRLAILALFASTGFAPPFWARDLGALVRRLADPSPAPDERDRAVFSDLVELANCEPLPSLDPADPDWPLRQLIRVEAARGARLQRDGRVAGTLWAEWPRPDYFRREEHALSGDLLRWPVEQERWPDEVLQVPLSPSRCEEGIPPRSEVLTLELLERLEAFARARGTDARNVLATAAYAFVKAAPPDASIPASVVQELDPAAVEPRLSPFVRLLRAERRVSPPSEFLSLASEPELRAARWAAVVAAIAQGPTAAEVVAISEDVEPLASRPATRAIAMYVAFHRVNALRSLGRTEEARALLRRLSSSYANPSSSQAVALRGLAVSLFASGPLQAEDIAAIDGFDGWEAVGTRALVAGQEAPVRLAVERLRQSSSFRRRVSAERLASEWALIRRDAAAFALSTARLASALSSDATARERGEASDVVLALYEALVRRDAEQPDTRWEARVRHAMGEVASWLDERHARALEGLQGALAANPRSGRVDEIALGILPVEAAQAPPPAPEVQVEWPEPYSLLAIPAPDGTLRSGFVPAARALEVVHAR